MTVTPTDSTGRTFDVQTYSFATSPTTSVLAPSSGATLSGNTTLDASASNTNTVEFVLSGGSYSNHIIGTATPAMYGWLYNWDTTTVRTVPIPCVPRHSTRRAVPSAPV